MIYLGTDPVIGEILEEHVETLAFLWERWMGELRDPEVSLRAFSDLEERILAHADALRIEGSGAVPRLRDGLAAEEACVSLSSGYVLLEMGDPAARLVVDAFREAKGPAQDGLRRALSYGDISVVGPQLREIAARGPEPAASASAEALAFHGEGPPAPERLPGFLKSGQPGVRRAAWRIVALLDGTSAGQASFPDISRKAFEAGFGDEDAAVWRQALETAAWTGQPWLLEYCRGASADPSPDRLEVLRLLSILGEPSDLDRVAAAGRAACLGTSRFGLLEAYGHPGAIDLLLEEMRSGDEAAAVAAGTAYRRITGADIDSGKRVRLLPPGGGTPDAFEEEFSEEADRPDPEKAEAHWARARESFSRSVRWRRGIDADAAHPDRLPGFLDNEARFEACLRARFRGVWKGALSGIEGFPRGGPA